MTADRSGPTVAALVAFFGLGFAWSTAIPLGRVAGNAGIPALIFPFVQAAGASLTLGLVLLLFKRRAIRGPVPWALFLVSGTFGHALPQFVAFLAVQRLPIGVVGLIIALNPLLTGLIAAATGTQALTARRLIGIGLGLSGVALVALPGVALPSTDALPWVILAIATPLCFAIANTYSARLRPVGSDSTRDAFGMMTVSALSLLIAVALMGAWYWPDPSAPTAGDGALLVHGLIAGVAFILFFVVLERGGPIMVASASYVILILSTLWGWTFFGERPGGGFLIAAGLVMTGLYLMLSRASSGIDQ